MIIRIDQTTTVDTDIDLGPAERHVLQKLFGWKSTVSSVKEFREKKALALRVGWNNSGPVQAGHKLTLIMKKLETEVRQRLNDEEHEADDH